MHQMEKKILSKRREIKYNNSKKLHEKGLKSILVSNIELVGKYLAKDVKDKNNEILVGAGFDITEEQLEKIITQLRKKKYSILLILILLI